MSAVTDALEREVSAIRALPAGGDARTRHKRDGHYARILRLIAPRIRHFTRAYGLLNMADDAQQACAIGVHRAICAYDPARARFTTFLNWQLRCELQALRHRMRLDSRDSARRVGARTVSLEALAADGLDRPIQEIEDEGAERRVEADCAARLAQKAFASLLARYEERMRDRARREIARRSMRSCPIQTGAMHPQPIAAHEGDLANERAIVTRYVFADGDDAKFDSRLPLDNEQQRQIARRVLRNLRAQVAAAAVKR